jgi:hypothetical protein
LGEAWTERFHVWPARSIHRLAGLKRCADDDVAVDINDGLEDERDPVVS